VSRCPWARRHLTLPAPDVLVVTLHGWHRRPFTITYIYRICREMKKWRCPAECATEQYKYQQISQLKGKNHNIHISLVYKATPWSTGGSNPVPFPGWKSTITTTAQAKWPLLLLLQFCPTCTITVFRHKTSVCVCVCVCVRVCVCVPLSGQSVEKSTL